VESIISLAEAGVPSEDSWAMSFNTSGMDCAEESIASFAEGLGVVTSEGCWLIL
jgi:hypothetical protein